MKNIFLMILMIGVGIGVVGCEDDEKDSPLEEKIIEFTGRVTAVYSDDASDCEFRDGSDTEYRVVLGYVIVSDDGVRYDPRDSLPSDYKTNGLYVWILAEDLEKTSSLGELIKIKEIDQVGVAAPN